jgi:fumarylacetoacetase
MPETWIDLPEGTPYGLSNLPYGVFTTSADPDRRRIGVRIGGEVLDLGAAAHAAAGPSPLLDATNLNPLMAAGRPTWTRVRSSLIAWLADDTYREAISPHLHPLTDVTLHLPFEPADYVDFYASEHHAANLGALFRPGSPPLLPNWKHLPVGYHGRAGSLVVSGTPAIRPSGQFKEADRQTPTFGPSRKLDIEAEVGFVVGTPTEYGQQVTLDQFPDHVFGVCLVNDWSARDLQAWEYVPLGPFLGKSFATSLSPWIVPLDVPLLSYLDDQSQPPWGLDIELEVRLNGHLISRPPFASMYWTAAQQLAHTTVNGARLRAGDFYASGTVSGPHPTQRGSLIELSWNGQQPIKLPDGQERTFLEDGDEVIITAVAPGPEQAKIGFGELSGRVVPG